MALRPLPMIYLCILTMIQYLGIFAAKDMDLYCGACKAIVDEVEYSISQIDPKKMIDVGSFRLDPNGKQRSVKVPLARSESQLTELLENVCEDISSDYVQNKDKETGKKSIKRMVTRDGKMSSEVDFQALMQNAQNSGDKPPDTDSKKVKFICESIIEEHEEDFIESFSSPNKNVVKIVCSDIAEYCEESDDEESEEKDEL